MTSLFRNPSSHTLDIELPRVVTGAMEHRIARKKDVNLSLKSDAVASINGYSVVVVWRRLPDIALVVVVIAWGQADVWAPSLTQPNHVVGSRILLAACYAAAGLFLLFRQRMPLASAMGVFAALAVPIALYGAGENLGAFLPAFVAIYSVGAHSHLKHALAGLIAFAVWSVLFLVRDPFLHSTSDYVRAGFYLVLSALPWVLGVFVRNPRLRAIEWERRATRLERERRLAEEAAARDERARVARELHDVVSHTVGVILRQAQAGDALLTSNPANARKAFQSIETSARETMIELRRMLGLLREEIDGNKLAPQPGLAQLPVLVEEIRSAGLDVQLEITGPRCALSRGLDLNAYRIIQEALTNSLKHANAGKAQVCVRFTETALEIQVTDDGLGRASSSDGGHGLSGMRERVLVHGGQFQFGHGQSGGFSVWAKLPLESMVP